MRVDLELGKRIVQKVKLISLTSTIQLLETGIGGSNSQDAEMKVGKNAT